MTKEQKLVVGAWGATLAVMVIAFIAWGQGLNWNFSRFSSYKLFPLFGLTAFSIMWAHYMVAVKRQFHGIDKSVTKQYFEITSIVVLIAIMLHPGLLIWQLWRDGFGLPPSSYLENYVAPALWWAALLGTTAFFTFLAYELGRWFKGKKWWRYVQYASDIAMLFIFVHALKLGGDTQAGWFMYVWWFYGITLVASLLYQYVWSAKPKEKPRG